jgi:hypothetical protein
MLKMNGKGAGVIPRWKNMLVDYIKQRINEVVPSCNKNIKYYVMLAYKRT